MILSIIQFIALITSLTLLCFYKDGPVNSIASTVAGISGGAILQLIYDKWRYLKFLPRLILIKIHGKKLRISFASLVRIKIGSDYLLVKSKRISGQWQPVGGVYKFFDNNKVNELKLKSDTGFKKSEHNEFRKTFAKDHVFNALKLMKWFESQLGRETSPHREYREELIDTELVPVDQFSNPDFEYLSREYDFSYATKFNIWELKIFEIFEMKLTPAQNKLLKDAVVNKPDNLLLLDQQHIETSGFINDSKDYRVGEQTKYVL